MLRASLTPASFFISQKLRGKKLSGVSPRFLWLKRHSSSNAESVRRNRLFCASWMMVVCRYIGYTTQCRSAEQHLLAGCKQHLLQLMHRIYKCDQTSMQALPTVSKATAHDWMPSACCCSRPCSQQQGSWRNACDSRNTYMTPTPKFTPVGLCAGNQETPDHEGAV